MNGNPNWVNDKNKEMRLSELDSGSVVNKFQSNVAIVHKTSLFGSDNGSRKKFVSAHFDSYSVVLEKLQMFKSLKRVIITFYIPLSQIYAYLISLDDKQRNRLEEICILCDELYESKTLKYDALLRQEMKRHFRKLECQGKMDKIAKLRIKKRKTKSGKDTDKDKDKKSTKNKKEENENSEKIKSKSNWKSTRKEKSKISQQRIERMCKDLFPKSLKTLYLPVFASMNWIINEPFLSNLERLIINDINIDYSTYDCQWDISIISYLCTKCNPQKLKCLYLTVNRYYDSKLDVSWALKKTPNIGNTTSTNSNNNNNNTKANNSKSKPAANKNGDIDCNAERKIDSRGRRASVKRRLSGLINRLKVINNDESDQDSETVIYQMSQQLNHHVINLFSMFATFSQLEFITLKCVKCQRKKEEKEVSTKDLIAVILTMQSMLEKYGVKVYFSREQKNVLHITRDTQ